MDERFRGNRSRELDLNRRPLDSELENVHVGIEDRIRLLEAVTARARQRDRWREVRSNSETGSISVEPVQERPVNKGNGRKRNNKHLVGNALNDSDLNKDYMHGSADAEGFFDCNICLEVAKDPIVTCCGHLFCWSCFVRVPSVYINAKECPVCRGEVKDSAVTPIYGNGRNSPILELESGVKVPPRPRARRVESLNMSSDSSVSDAIRRVRLHLESISESQDADWQHPNIALPPFFSVPGSSRPIQSRQATGSVPGGVASLSSLTWQLSRLVEDLETLVNGRLILRTDAQLPPANNEDPSTSNAVDTH